MKRKLLGLFGVVVWIGLVSSDKVFGQGASFGYQGRLNAGNGPANGIYDLTFSLFNTATNGEAASVITSLATPVSNGVFNVALDFGPGAFNGAACWLQVGVRTNGSGAFTDLLPRQPILSVPYSTHALHAGIADSVAPGSFSGAIVSIPATNTISDGALFMFDDLIGGLPRAATINLTNLADRLGRRIQASGPTVTVSSKGIANGLSTATNAGLMFGPDTPGTTTCGIQEAINSLPRPALPVLGGGKVMLGPGEFRCSGTIYLPNREAVYSGAGLIGSLVIEGSGEGATRLVYTGSGDFIVNADNSGANYGSAYNNNLDLVFRDFGIFYLNDTEEGCLIYLSGANHLLMENLFFAPYQMLTIDNGGFSNPYVYFNPPTHPVGTIGLRMDSGANRVTLRNCAFSGLALGTAMGADHSAFEDCIWANCGCYGGAWGTVYTPTGGGNNINVAVNNLAAWGGGIAGVFNTYEMTLVNPQFYFNSACIIKVPGGAFAGPMLTIINPLFESGINKRILIGFDGQSNPSGSVSVLHQMAPDQLSRGADGLLDVYNGTGFHGSLPYGGSLPVYEYFMDAQGLSVVGRPINLPRCTKAERGTLATQTGAAVFQTDNFPGLRVWNGAHWVKFTETDDD